VDELPRDARKLLDLTRHADDPTAAQRAQSDAALRAALARHGVEGLPLLSSVDAPAPHVRQSVAQRGVLALKFGAGALAVVAAAYVGVRWLSPRQDARPMAAKAPVVEAPVPRDEPSHATPSAEYVPNGAAPAVEHRDSAQAPAPVAAVRRSEARRALRAHASSLEAELRTVASVDALVREQRFADALRVLGRTETEAAVVLHEERTALRILARCGLDPSSQARREREQFLRASPHSVLADRVRGACVSAASEKP
jgi:hypothetical protein